jgi:hypothetical protein
MRLMKTVNPAIAWYNGINMLTDQQVEVWKEIEENEKEWQYFKNKYLMGEIVFWIYSVIKRKAKEI